MKKMVMKLIRSVLGCCALLMFPTALPAADFSPVQGDLAKKVDSYDYFVDYSGSMMMSHKTLRANKMELAKKMLSDINALLPELDYYAGLHTFAPYGALLAPAPWQRPRMAAAVAGLDAKKDVFGRNTDMGDGLIDHAAAIAAMPGRKALIFVSDGEVNTGPNPVIEARRLLENNPELCLHVVSLADSAQGQSMLLAISRLKGCNVMADAAALTAGDGQSLRQFVSDVFYEENMEEVIVLRGVNFAFDSDALDATARGILNEIASVIARNPARSVLLNGFTDSLGSDAYNRTLSQRRADAVRTYLAGRGIPAARLLAQGKGKSFTYDNSTEEGCYMNRRVEVSFVD
jgi:OOP family OmpA-OmpF porin